MSKTVIATFAEIAATFPARGLRIERHPSNVDKVERSPVFGYERTCAICGKEFLSYPGHVYHKSKGSHTGHHTEYYFCSWSCMRKYENAPKGEGKK